MGPFIDQALTQRWIGDYHFSTAGLECLIASCTIAILVNISQFMCLGRFSALTFQVGERMKDHAPGCGKHVLPPAIHPHSRG